MPNTPNVETRKDSNGPGVPTAERIHVCECKRFETRKRVNANGVRVAVRQCLDCGRNKGNVKRESVTWDALEWWDQELFERGQQMISDTYKKWRDDKNENFWNRYNRHLASPEWQELRRLVFDRCEGTCEGCGNRRATQAHHLTYAHLGNEFLFEIRGVCNECHDRIHAR